MDSDATLGWAALACCLLFVTLSVLWCRHTINLMDRHREEIRRLKELRNPPSQPELQDEEPGDQPDDD